MSKFTPDHHRSRSKKSGAGSGGAGGRDLSTLQAAMMASESKVADWLAQNDPTLVRSESTEDDSKSIKSDVPVHLKRLKGGGCLFLTFLQFSGSLTKDSHLHSTPIIFPCELSVISPELSYYNVTRFYTLSQFSICLFL